MLWLGLMHSSLKRSSYYSGSMAQRRSCIQSAARQLIAEAGFEGMSMRALAERSEVAYSTLYNIYGNKETVVTSAVAELFEKQLQEADAYIGQDVTRALDGALRRLEWFAQEILTMPQYARAMVSMFFSGNPGNTIHDLLRSLSSSSYRRLLDHLAAYEGLAPWVDLGLIADELSSREFAVVHDWAIGRVSAEKLAGRQKYALLLTLGSVAQGVALERVHLHLSTCQSELIDNILTVSRRLGRPHFDH